MVICPDCENEIDVDEDVLDEGEVISCPECGSDFEVVTTEPFELAKVEDEDEEEEELKEEESEESDY